MSAVSRWWRRFQRQSAGGKARIIGPIVAVIVLIAALIVFRPTSNSSTAGVSEGTAPATDADPEATADDSAPGVTADSIRVVFPTVSLTSLAGTQGFASDIEYGWQEKAITTFVNDINNNGGINGRHIDAKIVPFDPTNPAGMRALCKDWTEGSSPAFAVVDGLGAWEGDNQLCVAQEGKTPFIAQWSTVSSYTQQAAPYLWWTAPDQSVVLNTVVAWGAKSGALSPDHPVGILVGDRATDQAALNDTVLPALHQLGIDHPVVATMPASPDAATASIAAKAPLVVQQFRDAGVTTVLPLIPFNVFFPYLQTETQQEYFPKLLLSDYESSIEAALGLIPVPYEKALDGQQGVTTMTLGESDYPSSVGQGGYDPGVQSCYDTWKATNAPPPPPDSPYLEAQGPVVAWCQGVRLFAEAARNAGPDLNRRTFVQAMSQIQNFDGTNTPILSFGPTKFYGPVNYRVVQLHNNDPPSSDCKLQADQHPQGTCWVVVQDWQPLVSP